MYMFKQVRHVRILRNAGGIETKIRSRERASFIAMRRDPILNRVAAGHC